MDVQQLIDRCGRGDSAAWAELWERVLKASQAAMRHVLRSWTADETLLDDLRQDLYFHLGVHLFHFLSGFRGDSEAELGAYIRTAVIRFAQRTLRKWARAERREAEARRQYAESKRNRPGEGQLDVMLQDLAAGMPEKDQRKSRILAAASPFLAGTAFAQAAPARHYARRTLERYQSDLRAHSGRRSGRNTPGKAQPRKISCFYCFFCRLRPPFWTPYW
ncbi:MAG TPA: hypothetical protein VG013_32840 [Gemmataceae bacterium]|jgi:hypothetical protein|nr:hypothetical protein [Gemmataceae bacterium]